MSKTTDPPKPVETAADFLKARARGGKASDLDWFLERRRNVAPDPGDELP